MLPRRSALMGLLPAPYLKVIEAALAEAIERLSRAEATPAQKSLLVEARRLRAAMATWHAIPPDAEIEQEMLARVKSLTAEVGASLVPPPLETSPATANSKSTPPKVRSSSEPPRIASGYTHVQPLSPISSGITRVRPATMEWEPYRHLAGVTMKPVHHVATEEAFCAILKMDAGAEIPRRRHAGPEDIFVIEGALTMGDIELRAGDACHSDAGTLHEPMRSAGGCTLFVVGSAFDELLH